MKITMQNGKVTATAETLSEIQQLIALGGGEKSTKKPMMFDERACGYCHKVFKRLGKHTPKCESRAKKVENGELKK